MTGKVIGTEGTNTIIEVVCPCCHRISRVKAPTSGWQSWQNGVVIQRAMPQVSANVREQLISGLCPKCWDYVT